MSRQHWADRTPSCPFWFGRLLATEGRLRNPRAHRGRVQSESFNWWASPDQEVHTSLGECYIVTGASYDCADPRTAVESFAHTFKIAV